MERLNPDMKVAASVRAGTPVPGITNNSGGGTSSPTIANIFVPEMPLTIQGDSISALNDDSGWIYWTQYYTYGRWGYPAGTLQAISGSEIAENNNFRDIMRTDRYNQMIDCVSSDQALMLMIGTNTLAGTYPPTPQLNALDTIWSDIRAKGANIIGALVLPSASNFGLPSVTTFNNHITAQGSNDDFLVVDGPTAWGGTYVGNTDSGNLHPNILGAQKIGQAVATALTEKGYEIGASYGQGGSNPADNTCLNWSFTGTAGAKAGSNSAGISGNVPTSTDITLNSNGVTMVVSTTTVNVPVLSENPDGSWSSTIEAFPALQMDITGTASNTGTNSVLMRATISPSEVAGSTYECFNYFTCTKTDGISLPSGVTLGMLGNSASPGRWANANTNAGAGNLAIPLTGGVARTLTTNVPQTVGPNGVTFQWKQAAGVTDLSLIHI